MKTVKQCVKYLETRRTKIGAERDKLRSVISDFEDLAYEADQAIEHIEIAIDHLSSYA